MINNKNKNFISAVVYVYNNENQVYEFLSKISNTLKNNFEKFEIICVNDSSTDNSVKKIKEFTQNTNNNTGGVISVVNMSYYHGVESSMNAGVDMAIGDFVYEFDTVNIDYNQNVIIDIYNRSLQGFDIVSAISDCKRRKTSKFFYRIFNNYANNAYKLKTETFRLLSRRAINRVNSINQTVFYRKAVYANCGLKLDFIQYKHIDSKKVSTQTDNKRANLAINSLILFTNIAYRFSLIMTITFLCSMISVFVYSILVFMKGTAITGWTTTMLFMSFAFFGIFTFFAIIIKYLSIIMNLIFKKQKYIIESIEKISN